MKKALKQSLFFWLVVGFIFTLFVYCVVCWADERNPFLNFGVVEQGKLYRSALPAPKDIEAMHSRYGIQTIICLKGSENEAIKKKAKELGMDVVEIRLRASKPPGISTLKLIFNILNKEKIKYAYLKLPELISYTTRKPKAPFLLHCQMGADRTGYVSALYRICFQGWSVKKAKLETLRYLHLPLRYPQIWRKLKQLQPEQFCPLINPKYNFTSE